ncbi:hypothetical protein SVAN01_01898 [Stagonosporopsis vannaccii]|nr:hypothetical protein SVAN01_01898 [Stagonosporopsis vannaccii]
MCRQSCNFSLNNSSTVEPTTQAPEQRGGTRELLTWTLRRTDSKYATVGDAFTQRRVYHIGRVHWKVSRGICKQSKSQGRRPVQQPPTPQRRSSNGLMAYAASDEQHRMIDPSSRWRMQLLARRLNADWSKPPAAAKSQDDDAFSSAEGTTFFSIL